MGMPTAGLGSAGSAELGDAAARAEDMRRAIAQLAGDLERAARASDLDSLDAGLASAGRSASADGASPTAIDGSKSALVLSCSAAAVAAAEAARVDVAAVVTQLGDATARGDVKAVGEAIGAARRRGPIRPGSRLAMLVDEAEQLLRNASEVRCALRVALACGDVQGLEAGLGDAERLGETFGKADGAVLAAREGLVSISAATRAMAAARRAADAEGMEKSAASFGSGLTMQATPEREFIPISRVPHRSRRGNAFGYISVFGIDGQNPRLFSECDGGFQWQLARLRHGSRCSNRFRPGHDYAGHNYLPWQQAFKAFSARQFQMFCRSSIGPGTAIGPDTAIGPGTALESPSALAPPSAWHRPVTAQEQVARCPVYRRTATVPPPNDLPAKKK